MKENKRNLPFLPKANSKIIQLNAYQWRCSLCKTINTTIETNILEIPEPNNGMRKVSATTCDACGTIHIVKTSKPKN